MRTSTVILFGLLIVLLALSSTDGFRLFGRSKHRHSQKDSSEKESAVKKTESTKATKKHNESVGGEEDLLSLYSVKDDYRKYYESSGDKPAPINLSQQPPAKSVKSFDTDRAQNSAEYHMAYLKSIGGGSGVDRTIEQQLAKNRIRSHRKYN